MHHFSIKPEWKVLSPSGSGKHKSLVDMMELLSEIDETGNIATACKRLGISYRHGWGVVRDFELEFQVGLLVKSRSKGSELTSLAKKLIWANKRFEARLGPLLEAFASELEHDIAADSGAAEGLKIRVSHGFAVAELLKRLEASPYRFDFKYEDVAEALTSLSNHECDVAGFNIPRTPFNGSVTQLIRNLPDAAQRYRFLYFVDRSQGILTAPGNPKKIHGVRDFVRPDVLIVNRQSQSGTKNLLDHILQAEGVSPEAIKGYANREQTHEAVAAYVASGMADAGVALQTGADKYGLHYQELTMESCYLVFEESLMGNSAVQDMIETIQDPAFRGAINRISGYRCAQSARILRLHDILAG